jgi:flavin-dependent dehydrogenase
VKDGGYDVIVCGAGPGGCALAAKLASGGASILLIEKEDTPGDGRAWVVDVERGTFDEARVPVPGPDAMWREAGEQVMTTSDGSFSITMHDSPLRPVRNREYVRQLASWAEDSGAEVRTGLTVASPVLESGSVTAVETADGERLCARVVADCTGISGLLRRQVPAGWLMGGLVETSDTVLARREVLSIDPVKAAAQNVVPDGVRVDRASPRGSYSVETAFMDIEDGFVDLLVGQKAGGGRPTADEAFTSIVEGWGFTRGKLFGDGGPIPIRRPLESLVGDGFITLGDAACQVIPMHGSGTASALIAADIAAEVILETLDSGRCDRAALWPYSHRFMSGRGAVLAYYDVLRKHAESLESDDVNRLLIKGIMTADDVREGLVPKPFERSPLELLRKLRRGITSPVLLSGFAFSGARAMKTLNHYRKYPATFDEETLRRWVSGIPA